jgi:tRNA threonylcarbamoyladenosine biosynthesis protein TsaB
MNKIKPVLAIETSAALCSVCVYFDTDKYFTQELLLKHSHAEKLFQLTDNVLKLAGIQIQDLEAVVVSAGPGSFTGLRIGYSAAKGIALGANLPIAAIPTFEALAMQISQFLPEGSDFIIANKVNMDEVYFARFHVKANSFIFAENLQILSTVEFVQKTEDLPVFGSASPDLEKKNISAPSAKYLAEWFRKSGTGEETFNFDFNEPNYMKNFIIKERKK